MTFSAGERLGTYEIVGSLGAGGMGEVYLARDTRLKREVAIKILPEVFYRDAQRLARFQREAEVLASLNHRHIAAIYDLVDGDPSPFLVLELVEGETLADRIQRSRIPVPEALRIAAQIAEALQAAHDTGVIHRDVKPANIKITPDGNVKVLDFGLAKVREGEGGGVDLSNSPTIMLTSSGTMLGTAPYMSPEQVNGRPVDRSSDMWAFGCVLYEMLAGRRPFEGDTVNEIVAGILKTDPDWRRLPDETPEGIRRLLRRCLRKDRTLRFRDAGDARLEIADAQSSAEHEAGVAPIRPARRERIAWVSALALVTLIAAFMGARALRPAAIATETRLEITTPPTSDAAMAISPDGLKIVYAAKSGGQSQLWLRTLDSPVARPLPGTEHAFTVFWSPDSRSIGFMADAKLKRMDIDGGSAQTLASAPAGMGGAWNRDGTILFSSNPGRPILRIPAKGGEPVAVTRFESPQQGSQSSPRFLADDRHFLFFVTGRPEARGVYVGSLDGLDTKRLFDADTPAACGATGHLLFVRDGQLLAQAFDPVRLEPKGDPLPVAEHVNGGTLLSASAAGPLAYRTASADSGQRYLLWVDRSGREISKVVYPDTSSLAPALSRDGRRVAVFRYVNGNMDIWSYDTERRTWDRVTFDSGDDVLALWSPDGSRVAFGSNRKRGIMDLYSKLLGAAPGSEELLLATPQPKFLMDWSPDGRFLLYNALNANRDVDVWALPLDGTRTPFAVVQTEFNEQSPQFSPDGKWIAYQSDKTGRVEIYVQPFPGPGVASPLSTEGGAQVRWNANGKELFYIAPDERLMTVPMRFSSDGKTVQAGAPLPLFVTTVGATNAPRQQYMVAPDGQSFVMNSMPNEATASPIMVILNWKPKH
jgi:Tol biopolymer transport system component/tRNA A-37 threonylcarbamoyl transferase component Bud32